MCGGVLREGILMRYHAIRPGLGLAPKYLEHVLGKTLRQDVKRRTTLGCELLW